MDTKRFAEYILKSEMLYDWKIKFSTSGSICLKKSATIILDERHKDIFDWRSREAVIHEIAHIRTWPQDRKHSSLFWTEYAKLILTYLCNGDPFNLT